MTDAEAPSSTEDRLLGGRVVLSQPADGYRVAIDPVLLAAAVAVPAGGRALDLGCGTGAASLCLATRLTDICVVGVEVDAAHAALARANVAANGLADRVRVIDGDVADAGSLVAAASFDHVLANPPFLSPRHTPARDPGRRRAMVEGGGGLAPWIAAGDLALKPKGWLTLIHRADRLHEVLALLWPRFATVRLLPLWPKAGRPAKRIILAARKGGRAGTVMLPGLVLHEADGRFTTAADAILRGGAALGAAGAA